MRRALLGEGQEKKEEKKMKREPYDRYLGYEKICIFSFEKQQVLSWKKGEHCLQKRKTKKRKEKKRKEKKRKRKEKRENN